MIRATLAAALTLALSACSVPRLMTADISYYSQQSPVDANALLPEASDPRKSHCLFIVDARERTSTSGWSFPRDMIGPWFLGGVQARLGLETHLLPAAPAEGPYLALDNVYIKHIATSMSGVTILRAHDRESSNAYRGNQTRLNWNGTDREFSRILSQSLDSALVKVPVASLVRSDCNVEPQPVELDVTAD